MLKRGAIAGGAVLWAAPVVSSLTSPAYAQADRSPSSCAGCYCEYESGDTFTVVDHPPPNGILNEALCDEFCADRSPNDPVIRTAFCASTPAETSNGTDRCVQLSDEPFVDCM